jgi:hypothetical protein
MPVCVPSVPSDAAASQLPSHLRRGALAVGVIEHNVLGARQRGGRVHGRRHVQQRQLQVRRRRRRLLRVVLRRGQQLRVAAVQMAQRSGGGISAALWTMQKPWPCCLSVLNVL